MNELNLKKSPSEAQNIEAQLKIAIEKSIKNTLYEAKLFFEDESEIHGYLRCELKHQFKKNELLKDKTDLIIRECKTKLCYHHETGTDNGIIYMSPKYEELRQMGYSPGSAYFDFGIWNANKSMYYEGREPIPKALIGIEVKRQRQKNNNKPAKKEDFIKDIIKDCKKLTNAGNELKYKYLLIILYYPDVFTLDVKQDLGSHLGDINVAYCVVNKESKQIAQQVYIPKNWQDSNV